MKALTLLLTVISFAANAEVYRCQINGKTVLTDKACNSETVPESVRKPNVVTATPGERELARQYDRRIERDRQARDRADRQWVKEHTAAEVETARIQDAVTRRKVVRGMTPDQVRMLLGHPASINASSSHNSDIEQWIYGDGKQSVTFKNDRVSAVSGAKKKRKK